MKTILKITALSAVLLGLAGIVTSCETENELVTGTVIGYYFDGSWAELLVQVDAKYSIGKTLEYVEERFCLTVLEAGTYRNVIRVQQFLPPLEIVGQRISFSYRAYNQDCPNDIALFLVHSVPITILCIPPWELPLYTITNFQILK